MGDLGGLTIVEGVRGGSCEASPAYDREIASGSCRYSLTPGSWKRQTRYAGFWKGGG